MAEREKSNCKHCQKAIQHFGHWWLDGDGVRKCVRGHSHHPYTVNGRPVASDKVARAWERVEAGLDPFEDDQS